MSQEGAVEAAKRLIAEDGFFEERKFASASELPALINQTANCCAATRVRNEFFVIEWRVSVVAEKGNQRLVSNMTLSNCGAIFSGTRFQIIEARR
ncbi:MAG: hypothetical protein ACOY4O_12285 [Pseudomonadota bacterium]